MKYAIRAGIGIGMIPDYMSENDTDLVPILPDIEAPRICRSCSRFPKS